MNCEEAARILLEAGAAEAGADRREMVKAHCDECENCRALLAAMEELGQSEAPRPSTARAVDSVTAGMSKVLPAPPVWKSGARMLLAAGVPAGLFLAVLGLAGLRAMSAGQAAAFLLLAACCWTAGWLAIDGAMRPGSARWVTGSGALIIFSSTFAGALMLLGVMEPSEHLISGSAVCFATGFSVTLAVSQLIRRMSRWGYAVDPAQASAATAAAGALAGLFVLQFFCPKNGLDHLVLGHGAGLAAGILLSLGLARRLKQN